MLKQCQIVTKILGGFVLACMTLSCSIASEGNRTTDISYTSSSFNNHDSHATAHLMWRLARLNGTAYHCAKNDIECSKPPFSSTESVACYGIPRIFFPKGGSSLSDIRRENSWLYEKTHDEIKKLAKLIDAAAQESGDARIVIQVVGHASSEGSDAINGGLSYTRAQTVARAIREHLSSRTKVIIDVEGRGAFEPWPNIDVLDECKEVQGFKSLFLNPKEAARDIVSELPTVRLSRRVEVRVLSSSLVSAAVGVEPVNKTDVNGNVIEELSASRRLAFYPSGTQPGHLLTVPLTKAFRQSELLPDMPVPPFTRKHENLRQRVSEVMMAMNNQIMASIVSPEFKELPKLGKIDEDEKLYVRLRIVPIYKSSSKTRKEPDDFQLVLDLARSSICAPADPAKPEVAKNCIGIDAPLYWPVHQRISDYVQKTINISFSGADYDDVKLPEEMIKVLNALLQSDQFKSQFAIVWKMREVSKNVLASIPKDIDGLMAYAHGLHRNLRFVDIKPDTNLTVRSATGLPLGNYPMWMGASSTFVTQSDPIHACLPDPRPRSLDQDSGVMLDPFAAWMSYGGEDCKDADLISNWTPHKDNNKDGSSLMFKPCSNLRKNAAGACTVRSFDDLQSLLQRGPARLFLPRDKASEAKGLFNGEGGGKFDKGQLDAFGTFIVVGKRTSDLDWAIKNINKAREDKDWKLGTWCTEPKDVDNLTNIICGIVLAVHDLSVDSATKINGIDKRVALGSRIVHVVPGTLSEPCLRSAITDFSQASLKTPLTISFGEVGMPVLSDRTDCRLLAIPLIDKSQISWPH